MRRFSVLLSTAIFCLGVAVAQKPSSLAAQLSTEPFDDLDELSAALMQPGRCPLGAVARYMEPCAVIGYAPLYPEDAAAAVDFVYRPVFRIVSGGGGRLKVWTINRSKLIETSLDLAFLQLETTSATDGAMRLKYVPVHVIGNVENEALCKAGKPCFESRNRRTDMFKQYRFSLSTVEADKVWK